MMTGCVAKGTHALSPTLSMHCGAWEQLRAEEHHEQNPIGCRMGLGSFVPKKSFTHWNTPPTNEEKHVRREDRVARRRIWHAQ